MQSFFNQLFFPIADFRSHFPEPASAGIYLFIFIFGSTLLGAAIFKGQVLGSGVSVFRIWG